MNRFLHLSCYTAEAGVSNRGLKHNPVKQTGRSQGVWVITASAASARYRSMASSNETTSLKPKTNPNYLTHFRPHAYTLSHSTHRCGICSK